MKLSEQRISHLAHLVVDGLWRDDLLEQAELELKGPELAMLRERHQAFVKRVIEAGKSH